MSERRSNSATATAAVTDAALARGIRKNTTAGTPQQRRLEAEAMATGIRYRRNLLALNIMETIDAMIASKVPVPERAYLMPEEEDPDTGEMTAPDARAVLEEWEGYSAPGRGAGIGRRDRSQMTDRDLLALGWYARNCANRMTRGKLPEDVAEDIGSDARLAILERAGVSQHVCVMTHATASPVQAVYRVTVPVPATDNAPSATRVYMCREHAAPHPDRRRPLLMRETHQMPRWDALRGPAREAEADLEQTAAALEATNREVGIRARQRSVVSYANQDRSRWRGFCYLEARRAVGDWRAQQDAETAADFNSPDGSEDASPEARAAAVAEVAGNRVLAALEAGTPLVYAYGATADGKRLTAAERDALALALTGLTRAELAKARGVNMEAVKVGANRGRKALAARLEDDRGKVRAWTRAAAARQANIDRPATDRPLLEQLQTAFYRYSGARQQHSDRMAPLNGGDTGHVPTRKQSAGKCPVTGEPVFANLKRDALPGPRVANTPAPGEWRLERRFARIRPAAPVSTPNRAAVLTAPDGPRRHGSPAAVLAHIDRVLAHLEHVEAFSRPQTRVSRTLDTTGAAPVPTTTAPKAPTVPNPDTARALANLQARRDAAKAIRTAGPATALEAETAAIRAAAGKTTLDARIAARRAARAVVAAAA